MDHNEKQILAIAKFRQLHESGCFVLPNPPDAGTAVYLEHLGFEAVATTSSGFAFSQGLPDTAAAIPVDAMLRHCSAVANAITLPVNADFQNGFADEPERVAVNVAKCITTGVAGLSIEDSKTDGASLYEFQLAVERISAARQAIDDTGIPVVLTGRCEVFLLGEEDPLRVALKRLTAYAEAGADCLYAPGGAAPDQIAEIVKAVAPKPVNVLVSRPNTGLTVSRLEELGVRRVSVGSALSLVAWGSFIRAATMLKEQGSFEGFAGAAAYAELNELFS